MKKLVFGAGINDATYATMIREELGYFEGKRKRSLVWKCPYHSVWASMIERCFSKRYKTKHPTYEHVTCCEEWLLFSNFKRWMEQQDWEGKQLDKDIIVSGNKMYSPETCAFVSAATNLFIGACDATRGEYPLGVRLFKATGRFQARCSNPFAKADHHNGYFDTPEEAHEAWRKRKHEYAQLVAETESDPRVVKALKKRYSVEEWYGNKT